MCIRVRPSDAFIQYKIDLVPVLQTENAYMGFTSGTGSAWGDHDILSWQFINTYTPIGECGLPYFTSIPTQLIQSGQTYVYEPAVSNKMQGHYVLNGPEGMSINPETGIVSWVVTNSDIGDHPVTVQYVTDSGKQAEQKYTLKVINASASDPAIISQPDGSVIAGNVFVYALSATDPNKTGLVWRIVDGPKGLALTNQQISWQTEKADIGKHSVSVEAMDTFALRDTQTFTIDVLSANKKPVIQSSPALTAVNAEQYEYVITATDPEGGVLHYDLLTAPEGMSITTNGKIIWTPVAAQTNQSFAVSVSVADNDDGITVQEWNIAVSDRVNHAPVISSTPPAQLMAGQAYSYTVEVSDPDGDSYTVVLAEAPAGMTLENNVVSWTPSTTIAAGNYAVKLVVRDDLGAETIQTFTLIVSKTPSSNFVPVITSEPETVAHPGIQYTYQLQATDAESDPLTYLLVAGPASASLSSSGKLIWTPATSDTGSYSFRLSVSDGIHTVLQTFNVSVSLSADNQGGMPVITSVPEFFNAKTGVNYEYTIQATDPENNPLTYALTEHPNGMTITQQGVINWIPSDSQQGKNAVRLSVSDGVNTSYQSFSINVVADTPAVLNINLNQDRDTIPAGESVTFQVAATGGTAPVTLALSLDGLNVSLDENHSAVLSPSTPGTHTVIAEAVDSEGYRVTQTAYIHVKDASDTQAPDVSISSPEDLTVVKGIISVQGKVSDANLVNYKLYLSPRGKKNWQELSSGNSDIDGEITQLDPSVLANGLYDLVLQATDINGQQNSDSIVLDISGDLKVGNFSVSYKDLDIPMSGIPMQVTRTYDSRRRAEQLDFGYGWSVDYQNIKIEESRDPGKGWALNQYNRGPYGVFVDFCVEPLGAPVVKVTLPDGKQEKFEAEASPRCNTYQPIIDVDVGFKAVGDTQSTLEILDGKHTRLVNGHLVETNYFSDPLNPSKYKLTTKTGYQYYLDQKFGIEKVITPNNQTITYSADGIIHSDGESILFTRDAGGRITAVTDPKGNVYKYTYTSAGDLGAVTSPLNDSDKTSFQYNSTHGVTVQRDGIDYLNETIVP